ncbi:MAG: hypothetical protein ACOYB2_10510 [Limnohabitans sp.]
MTAIVQPVGAVGGGGGTVPNARNERGSVTGLAPTASQTLVAVQTGTRKLRGFNVHGTTDGLAWVEVDGVPLAGIVARFSRVLPAYLVLPNPEGYASPTVMVALKVQNEGSVAGDFEGTLLGE